jgi:hypothetical protein
MEASLALHKSKLNPGKYRYRKMFPTQRRKGAKKDAEKKS